MNTTRQALIAILSIATITATNAAVAAQQTEISTLPTITIIGKRAPIQTVTIIGKRLSVDQKMLLTQQESSHKKSAAKRNMAQPMPVVG